MPSLFDTFRFTVSDGVTDTPVYPVNSGLKRSWQKEDGTRSYRMKLNTKLVFRKDDYTFFRAIYDAGVCTEISILIENLCGGDWVIWFEGVIPIQKGEYVASRCEVTFDVAPNDVYECANKGFNSGVNWLALVPLSSSKSIKVSLGTLETITCNDSAGTVTSIAPDVPQFYKGCWGTGYTTDATPDPLLAWKPIAHHQDQFYIGSPTDPDLIQATTTWGRETITSVGPPFGVGWINISGTKWVRPVNTMAVVQKYIQIRDTIAIDQIEWESTAINMAPISNGRSLGEILNAAVLQLDCGFTSVISNFFNINPDGTEPSNPAYDYAADNFQNVFFFQKSDIVRSTASNDATRFTISIKEFLQELSLLNVLWAITNVGGVKTLRIEHYTYFEGTNGIDLTTYGGGKYIVGLDRFKSESEVPNFESFAYQESYREKFLVKRITYPPACTTVQGDERTASQMNADFGGLVENPDAGLEGFFLMATEDVGGGEFLLNTLGGEANGAFAWENIIPALWADGRFHLDATANVPGYSVRSVARGKAQPTITFSHCCSDSFEPSELVRTQLGWGEVKTAEQDTERGIISLTLLH